MVYKLQYQVNMWCVSVVCFLVVGGSEVLSDGNVTEDENSHINDGVLPPLVFPNNSTDIRVNETAREILQIVDLMSASNITHNKTEIHQKANAENRTEDRNVPIVFPTNSSEIKEINETLRNFLLHNNTLTPPTLQNIDFIKSTDRKSAEQEILFNSKRKQHNPKDDSEWIQVSDENTEDELHRSLFGRKDLTIGPQRNHGLGVPIVRGQLAAILAGIFVVLAVGGYIALLSWRRYLENRYGNREMLVNEEELCEATDMKYFSVSKL